MLACPRRYTMVVRAQHNPTSHYRGWNLEFLHKTRTADAVLLAAGYAGGADQGHSGLVQASAAAGVQDAAAHAGERSVV